MSKILKVALILIGLFFFCQSYATLDATGYGPVSVNVQPNCVLVSTQYISGSNNQPAYVDIPPCPGGGTPKIIPSVLGQSIRGLGNLDFAFQTQNMGSQWKIFPSGSAVAFQAIAFVMCDYTPK